MTVPAAPFYTGPLAEGQALAREHRAVAVKRTSYDGTPVLDVYLCDLDGSPVWDDVREWGRAPRSAPDAEERAWRHALGLFFAGGAR